MRILIENGTEDLLNMLKNNGYDATAITELPTVEKVVEVEKDIPEYLKAIDGIITEIVTAKTEASLKEVEVYKTKLKAIVDAVTTETTNVSE